MNIFITNLNPALAPKDLDDKRLVKMILETAQLLSTSINFYGGAGPYRTTHLNHPCAVWTRTSRANYLWLLDYFIHANEEYTSRFPGRTYKSYHYLPTFRDGVKLIPAGQFTPPVNLTPFKTLPLTEAYRQCLIKKWAEDKVAPRYFREVF